MTDTVITEGHCNCGAVAFEISAPLTELYMCHCSICRRYTGGAGIVVAVFPKSEFRFVRGEAAIASWSKPGHDWQSWFCRQCGSSLPGENDENTIFVPAGLLSDTPPNLAIGHHIWVDSKATWDEISGSGQQHPCAFGTADPESNS